MAEATRDRTQAGAKIAAPGVHVHGVSIRYHSLQLFEDFNFELAAGQCTCLLGASGVGKTTLLRFVAGLLEDDTASGSITASDGLALQDRVAWMAQQDLLMPWLSVLDNVLLGARLRSEVTAGAVERARELIDAVGLSGNEALLPDALSGGMRQRAALARTLMEDRPVTLMDEPFAAVDAITRYRLQELSAELLNERTTLLVTHDPLEALRVGHAIYVMTGQPATCGEPIAPAGEPARPIDNPDVSALHRELLELLKTNGEAACVC